MRARGSRGFFREYGDFFRGEVGEDLEEEVRGLCFVVVEWWMGLRE